MATTEPIVIFIGSDRWQREAGAEDVLVWSIRKHCKRPINIRWLRAGDPGFEVTPDGTGGTWKIGRPEGLAWFKQGWGTDFASLRFAIPELMGFKGKALYLDVDMALLADIGELWDMPTERGYRCTHVNRTDVSLIDCEWFADKAWWPSIARMKPSGGRVFEYLTLLRQAGHDGIAATLPMEWNDIDGAIYSRDPERVKLGHWSDVYSQPYRPYEKLKYGTTYPFCKNRAFGELWWKLRREQLTEEHGPVAAERILSKAWR